MEPNDSTSQVIDRLRKIDRTVLDDPSIIDDAIQQITDLGEPLTIVLMSEQGEEIASISGDDASLVHNIGVKQFVLDSLVNIAYPDLYNLIEHIAKTNNGRINSWQALQILADRSTRKLDAEFGGNVNAEVDKLEEN